MISGQTIIVRIFIEVAKEQAENIAQNLKQQIGNVSKTPTIETYWKEPKWQEITLEVPTAETKPELALQKLAAHLGQGWNFGSEDATAFAIWHPGEQSSFIIDDVHFANLEVCSE